MGVGLHERHCQRPAGPWNKNSIANVDGRDGLPEQLVGERACGALWFQAELLSEQAPQALVAPADGRRDPWVVDRWTPRLGQPRGNASSAGPLPRTGHPVFGGRARAVLKAQLYTEWESTPWAHLGQS